MEGARTNNNQLVRWSVIADCQLIARWKEQKRRVKKRGRRRCGMLVTVIEHPVVKKRL